MITLESFKSILRIFSQHICCSKFYIFSSNRHSKMVTKKKNVLFFSPVNWVNRYLFVSFQVTKNTTKNGFLFISIIIHTHTYRQYYQDDPFGLVANRFQCSQRAVNCCCAMTSIAMLYRPNALAM